MPKFNLNDIVYIKSLKQIGVAVEYATDDSHITSTIKYTVGYGVGYLFCGEDFLKPYPPDRKYVFITVDEDDLVGYDPYFRSALEIFKSRVNAEFLSYKQSDRKSDWHLDSNNNLTEQKQRFSLQNLSYSCPHHWKHHEVSNLLLRSKFFSHSFDICVICGEKRDC